MTFRLIKADARALPIPDKSVQCVVTSPPYWGLRDYGVEGQLGMEPTPELFVANMVAVFGEVWRVLKDDGTLWMNLGDSYASYGKDRSEIQASEKTSLEGGLGSQFQCLKQQSKLVGNLKAKDLVGIPWMTAFALRAAGWYLRQDIIWAKPNPMPESVTDRCTKSHEYIFLLTKQKRYFYNNEAIKEPAVESNAARPRMGQGENTQYEQKRASWNGSEFHTGKTGEHQLGRAQRVWNDRFGGNKHTGETTKHSDGSIFTGSDTRNKRDVWTVPLAPYADAHFATFPPALITPCILAGSREGDTVLDPFNGAGTTGLVCQRLGRNYIGSDINEEYLAMTRQRLTGENPMFSKEVFE